MSLKNVKGLILWVFFKKQNILRFSFDSELQILLLKNHISVDYRFIKRLSKKPKNGVFWNFACNEINNLQESNSQI